MREIKFRGKSKMSIEELNKMGFIHENGWVEGNLIVNGDTPNIVGDLLEIYPEYTIHEFWVVVDSESVGQYTGLKDKNGNEIYEGDVVEITNTSRIFNGKNHDCESKVKYVDGHPYVWPHPIINGKIKRYGARLLMTGIGKYAPDYAVVTGDVKVIGNKFEDGGLLNDSK